MSLRLRSVSRGQSLPLCLTVQDLALAPRALKPKTVRQMTGGQIVKQLYRVITTAIYLSLQTTGGTLMALVRPQHAALQPLQPLQPLDALILITQLQILTATVVPVFAATPVPNIVNLHRLLPNNLYKMPTII